MAAASVTNTSISRAVMEKDKNFLRDYTASRTRIPRGPRARGIREPGTQGRVDYEWSNGEKRAWMEITHSNQQLPVTALSEAFNPLSSVCLWPHVDLRLIGPNVEVTAVELITFFPRAATMWHALSKRLEAGGWTTRRLREYIFWSRNLPISALRCLLRDTMADHLKVGRKATAPSAGWTLDTVSTQRIGVKDRGDLSDCFFVSLGDGVVEYPEGEDEGVLTKLVLHARTHDHWWIKLSDLEDYINEYDLDTAYGFIFPVVSGQNVQVADLASFERLFPDPGNVDPRDPDGDYVRKWWAHGEFEHT